MHPGTPAHMKNQWNPIRTTVASIILIIAINITMIPLITLVITTIPQNPVLINNRMKTEVHHRSVYQNSFRVFLF
jgi:hypothetical protein